MKIEDLGKATKLNEEIVFIKEQIDILKWTQSKTVVDRESLLNTYLRVGKQIRLRM